MSRVGKKLIDLPSGTDVSIVKNGITIKGVKGELNADFPNSVKLEKAENKLKITPLSESKNLQSCLGNGKNISQ